MLFREHIWLATQQILSIFAKLYKVMLYDKDYLDADGLVEVHMLLKKSEKL